MTHIYIGCDKIIGSRTGYFKNLSALEVNDTFDDRLTAKRLGQWRTDSPKGFAFVMAAHKGLTHPIGDKGGIPAILEGSPPASIGLLQDTEAVHKAWEHTLAQAALLSPKLIIVRTPLAFSPNDANRANLARFARDMAPKAGKAMVAWEPHGLWEPEEVIPLARELGLVPVFDPFLDLPIKPGHGTACFALYTRRGLRTTFNDFDMEDLLEHCESYQRAVIIFRGPRRFRDARLVHTILESRREPES